MTTTDTPTRAAVRAALPDLLTTGRHHHAAATPTTLAAVADTRAALADQHHTGDPAARFAHHNRRLTALTRALGAVAAAVFDTPADPHPAWLGPELAELAAITLAWLDALPPTPTPPDVSTDDESPF